MNCELVHPVQSGGLCEVERLCVDIVVDGGRVRRVVDDVSFAFGKGDYFALVGESGSGKSVTCQSIMRLLPPEARMTGSIRVAGQAVDGLSPAALRAFRRRSVGMIFQDPLAALNPVRTVGSQLVETLALHYPDEPASALRDRAEDALRSVRIPQPGARLGAFPFQMSGGLNQRVMIALALTGKPDLLIADEPTTALDMSVQAEILDLLDELRAGSGLGILLVTHDLGIVEDRATHIAVMQSGRLVESGSTARLISAPQQPYTQQLFEASRVRTRHEDPAPRAEAAKCLSFETVSKRFPVKGKKADGIVAADDVSFHVRLGEIVALVGESGSGKSTAAKMAVGMVRPDSGAVIANGKRVAGMPTPGVQLIFQHPKDTLDPLMTMRAQFHEVLWASGMRNAAERTALIAQTLVDVGLGEAILDRKPTNLSGGEAQRAVIARALLLKPKVLIADEPLSAVDVCLQKLILDCFTSLRDRLGIGILLITHDLRIVFDIADRVVVMKDGRVVEELEVGAFGAPDRDPYTRRLIAAMPGARSALAAEPVLSET